MFFSGIATVGLKIDNFVCITEKLSDTDMFCGRLVVTCHIG